MGKTTDDILAKIGCKNTKSRKAVIEVLENAENLFLQRIYFYA